MIYVGVHISLARLHIQLLSWCMV